MKNAKLTAVCAAILGITAIASAPPAQAASTAKEYALQYCKGFDTPNGDKWSDGKPVVTTRYGEGREYQEWKTCVTEKTKEFAVANDTSKAEYKPGDAERAYGEKYCSKESVWEGTTWYGRAAEASQPHRTMTNSNVYKDKNECITEKTREAYYAGVQVSTAPFEASSIDARAKDYCRLYEYETPGYSVTKHRHYGPVPGAFKTEEACLQDKTADLKKEAETIAALEGKVMQPWDGTQVQVSASPTDAAGQAPADLAGLIQQGKGNAINEDECAIWLCLPAGFPDGCGKAHSAMLKRLKKGRSALPDFASCAVGDAKQLEHGFSSSEETVIKVNGSYRPGYTCLSSRSGGKDGDKEYIPGCTGVYRKVTVTQHGNPVGHTHYELIRANKPWEGAPANP